MLQLRSPHVVHLSFIYTLGAYTAGLWSGEQAISVRYLGTANQKYTQ